VTALALLGAITLLPSCSLIVNFSECSTDSECPGANVCSDDSICVGPPACTNRSSCSNPGDYCLAGTCRQIDPEICQVLGPEFEVDELIYPIGGLMPLTGPNGTKGEGTIQGAQAAIETINQTGANLAQGKFRFITCDTKSDAQNAATVARYMNEELGIQGMIGAISSGSTQEAANSVTIPNGATLISPASTSPVLSGLRDNDLLWRTIASDALQAPAMAQLINTRDPAPDTIGVLVVDSLYGRGFQDEILSAWETVRPGLISDTAKFRVVNYCWNKLVPRVFPGHD